MSYDSINDQIKRSIHMLNGIAEELNSLPHVQALTDLMSVLEDWDCRYKEHCSDVDEQEGLDDGTTYNADCGEYIEYYVETDEMHTLSKAFRALKAQQQ